MLAPHIIIITNKLKPWGKKEHMVNVDFVRLFRRDHEKLFELILMDEVRFT